MTEEEIQQSVVEIMRLRLFGHESRAPEQVKEVLLRLIRTTYTEAIEEAANVPRRLKFREDSSGEYQNGYSDALLDVGAAVSSSSHGETEGEEAKR